MRQQTLPTDCSPYDLGRSTEVNRAMRGLGIHTLPQEPHVLHFLANQSSRDANFFTSDEDHLLAIEKLLGHNRSQPPEHVVPCVNNDALRADSRTRHHVWFSGYSLSLCEQLGFREKDLLRVKDFDMYMRFRFDGLGLAKLFKAHYLILGLTSFLFLVSIFFFFF